MDGRKNNGAKKGENRGQGRKPKSEELELIETITKAGIEVYGAEPYKALWGQIWEQAQTGSKDHQTMVLQYTYGKPKQRIEMDNTEIQFKLVKADD